MSGYTTEIIMKMMIADLKLVCKKNGLKQSGNKTELIARIIAFNNEEQKNGSSSPQKTLDSNSNPNSKPTSPQLNDDDIKVTTFKSTSKSTSKPNSKPTSKPTSPSNPPSSLSSEDFSKMTVPELKLLCKSKGLTQKGTKSELISKLTSPVPIKTTVKVANPIKTNQSHIIESIKKASQHMIIKKNIFGNHEHEETHFVFNSDRIVIGKQMTDGSVVPLVKDDLELCNKFMFTYKLPTNLDNVKSVLEEEEDESPDIDEKKLLIAHETSDDDEPIEEDVVEDEEEEKEDLDDNYE